LSRLNDLIRQLRLKDPALAADLQREVGALVDRRAFGLNFERHTPEAVELPGKHVRRGDKVRILPPRGMMSKKSDEMLWRVSAITRDGGTRTAQLEALGDEEETTSIAVDDLVVVAAFRDPIYPGLVSTGKVEHGGDKPFHTVINAENFHALQTLLFTHRGKVDCIYIDPPYNTGAKDWKYNNHYVESDDLYRHSKWLAFMERRLLLAKELLNTASSALIVTIDEKEVHRLGLLLGQVFEGSNRQMATSVISAKGAVRPGQLSRVEEHLFVVTLGAATLKPWIRNMLDEPTSHEGISDVSWLGLRRREPTSVRGARPNQFYPIFIEAQTGRLHSVGEPIPGGIPRAREHAPDGTLAVWPLKPNGQEMLWGLTPDILRRNWKRGYARVSRWNSTTGQGTVQYLPGGTINKIESGEIRVVGRADDGSVICETDGGPLRTPPKRVWNMSSHNAELGGTNVLSSMMPDRRFPFPKSLYAVEDILRFFIADLAQATVLDFFSGSGTTAHAVMRLNRQDGGRRQSICITNNEVAADEQRQLRKDGLRPGDPDWEKWGICDYITKPRIQAAITGRTPDGEPIKGDYKFTDEFPMTDGFEENVEFLTLTYQAPLRVASNREFERIAPLLWLRAGSRGRRVDDISKGWDVADVYGVIADFDHAEKFVRALADRPDAAVAFVVTDEDWLFESMCRELPERVEPVRLYEAYLRNFELESGRGAR
jgi:adenine-specific DNA-methyltransferase